MEVAQMIEVHIWLVNLFLGFLIAGVVLPLFTKSALGFKKAAFVYTMIFQALATMVAFAGIVAVFAGDLGWPLTTIVMMAVWAVMMYIEIQKHKSIKLAPLQDEQSLKLVKGAFVKISFVQVFLVVIVYVLMMAKAKGMLGV